MTPTWFVSLSCIGGWALRRWRLVHFVGLLAAGLTAAGAADVANYEQLRRFDGEPTDGELFFDGVIEASDGKLYGTTVNGGPQDGGVIFRMNRDGGGYELLHNFSVPSPNGISPWGSVIEGSDGNLYGATRRGGLSDAGTVFKLAKDGSGFGILRHFTTNENDGAFPLNSVIEGSDGRLYGRTLAGGGGDGSVVFALNKDGTGYLVLHSFAVGYRYQRDSYSGLMEGSDGKLYGTTYADGANMAGSVFRLNKNGSGFQTLHDFEYTTADGGYPYGGVSEAGNGVLYGATSAGGLYDWGTFYRINRDGTGYQVLRHFNATNAEGYLPIGAPIEGPGGLLYGTTYYGGQDDGGTIYTLRKDGTGFEFLHRFLPNGGDGFNPHAALRRGSDGALYGTTFAGPLGYGGLVFRIKPVVLTGETGGGGFKVHLDGFIGHIYAVDRAADLPPMWTELGKATNIIGRAALTDLHPAPGAGIYRARILNP